jgi:hypothetical protein
MPTDKAGGKVFNRSASEASAKAEHGSAVRPIGPGRPET